MIVEKHDVRKIHQLRVIGMLEADFDTALKIPFAKKLTYQAEQCGNFYDEQWGF